MLLVEIAILDAFQLGLVGDEGSNLNVEYLFQLDRLPLNLRDFAVNHLRHALHVLEHAVSLVVQIVEFVLVILQFI